MPATSLVAFLRTLKKDGFTRRRGVRVRRHDLREKRTIRRGERDKRKEERKRRLVGWGEQLSSHIRQLCLRRC